MSKPSYSISTGDSIYFSGKFKHNTQDNTYTCPRGQILLCMTKKEGTHQRKYANCEACSKCSK